MRISSVDATIVSVPYRHRELSSQVARDGVTAIIVKVTTDDGVVGWGESCAGADIVSVAATIDALRPIVLGRDPWNRGAIWADAHFRGLWNFREPTFSFAYAGIDMALWDICGKAVGRPLCDLLGGPRRRSLDYFCYLPGGVDEAALEAACRDGVERGYGVFYLKVGGDIEADEARVALVRRCAGPDARIRIDANGAWSVGEAIRNLARLDRFDIDFAEQPVPADPIEGMVELRRRTDVPIASNEGLWRIADVRNVIRHRAADVLVFSPYWVGSIEHFAGLSYAAALEGLAVCKHTHGELGVAAAAAQQVLLTLDRVVDGHQQTAAMMVDDVVVERLPIADGPLWPFERSRARPGLGVDVDEAKIASWHEAYLRDGPFLPYQPEMIAIEDADWPGHVRPLGGPDHGSRSREGRDEED